MKFIIVIVSVLALSLNINAQSDSCQVLLENIAGIYSGKCQDGLANGKGKSIGEDTYIGVFKAGLPDGKGKCIYQNGDTFQGYWKAGKKEGRGKFSYTLSGAQTKLVGYWKADEYMGVEDPDLEYRVTSCTGIQNYQFDKQKSDSRYENNISIVIKSAFTDFVPKDLRIENSSGQFIQTGRKFAISQYFTPLHCEINYTIIVGTVRKQCRFVFDILEEGKYKIVLSND